MPEPINKQDFFDEISNLPIDLNNKKILVGVSGGADSLCLALLLKDLKFNIIAAIVNHNLRSESLAEANKVGEILANHQIDHVILNWEHDAKPTTKIQELARNARFKLFNEYASQNGIKYLFLGHNQDDQAETFIFRLCKGSGLDGLTAIKSVTQLDDLTIVRPLLGYSRSSIEATLLERKQTWINDPSNQNTKFARVRIRNIVKALETEGLTPEVIAQTIYKLDLAKDCLNSQALKFINDHCKFDDFGFITISSLDLNSLHLELRYRVAQKLLKIIGGKYYQPKRKQLVYLINMLNPDKNSKAFTFCGCYICFKKDKIYFIREANSVTCNPIVADNMWDNRFNIRFLSTKKNLKIKPLGNVGYCMVPKELRRISMPYKAHWSLPAIWDNDFLIAVPHLEYYSRSDIMTAKEIRELKFKPKLI